MRANRRLRVLSNATSIDIGEIDATGTAPQGHRFRGTPASVEGRAAGGPCTPIREAPRSVLRIFGEGPDRRAIERRAHRWGIADRIRFEGQVDRDELLRTVATAGVFLHPAFHDEAGLAVAEALSLDTPVVCLDRGGPPQLLRYWPGALAATVNLDRQSTLPERSPPRSIVSWTTHPRLPAPRGGRSSPSRRNSSPLMKRLSILVAVSSETVLASGLSRPANRWYSPKPAADCHMA